MWKREPNKENIDVAILVSQKYNKNPYADDIALKKSLEGNGYTAQIVAWDDERIDFKSFKLAIIRSCWDYDERVYEFLVRMESISKYCKLINNLETIEANSNKYYLKGLESRGVRIVPTEFANTTAHAKTALKNLFKDRFSDRVVIKPVVSASGRDTYLLDRDDEDSIIKRAAAILKKKDVMLQPYISTIETIGEKSTVVIDGLPVYTMLKKPASGNFLVHEYHGGTYTETQIGSIEKAFVKQIISTFPERPVYMRVDYLFDQKGKPMLLELELIEPNLYLSKSELVLKKLTQRLIEILATL